MFRVSCEVELMMERPSPSYGRIWITKTKFTASLVLTHVPEKPDPPAVRLYTLFTVAAVPLGEISLKSSVSVLPSLESFQFAVRSRRPSFLRTTFKASGPSAVTDRGVPESPGWSVPSITFVSAPPSPSKSKAYVLAPRLSTFIWSVSLLLDGLSFQSPTKGSFAAHNAQVAKVVEIATKPITRKVRGVNFMSESPSAGEQRTQIVKVVWTRGHEIR